MSSGNDVWFKSADGREAVTVSAGGGVARFTLWRWADQTPEHPYPDAGWLPATLSGLYATPEDALKAAVEEHAWIRAALPQAKG